MSDTFHSVTGKDEQYEFGTWRKVIEQCKFCAQWQFSFGDQYFTSVCWLSFVLSLQSYWFRWWVLAYWGCRLSASLGQPRNLWTKGSVSSPNYCQITIRNPEMFHINKMFNQSVSWNIVYATFWIHNFLLYRLWVCLLYILVLSVCSQSLILQVMILFCVHYIIGLLVPRSCTHCTHGARQWRG
jgi:hypothetical protein